MANKRDRTAATQKKRNQRNKVVARKLNVPTIPMEHILSKRTSYRFPTNKDAYLCYVFWSTIPQEFKLMTDEQRSDFGFSEDLNPIFKIRSQEAFASYFELSPETIRKWKLLDRWDGDLKAAQRSGVVQMWKNKIDYNFSKKTAEYGDAARVKLWYELFMEHEEKHVIRHEGEVTVKLENGISFYDMDDIFPIALAKICARQGLDLGKVVNALNNSYYKPLEDAENLKEIEKFRFPSQVNYDFDQVEKDAERLEQESLKIEDAEVVSESSAKKMQMQEKLKKLIAKESTVKVPKYVEEVEDSSKKVKSNEGELSAKDKLKELLKK